jgi:hypothetical protein
MRMPDAFERQNALIEPLDHGVRIAGCHQMNDVAEPVIDDGDYRGVD